MQRLYNFWNYNGIQEGSKPASTTSSISSLDELPEQLPTIVREDCVIHPKSQTSWWGARDQEKWVYVKELGRGGFGVVQLERETKTNALRAIKKISTDTGSKIDYKRELSILIALKDCTDLFVQFLGWYQEKGCIFLAMEYVEHGDLRGYLEEFGQQSEGSAKEIGMQVLEGLVILHGRSICYRDLKPENILLSSLSPINIKLADFGISKTTVDTRLITRIGTFNYLAPEVGKIYPRFLKADGEYKNSVDLWSLGCLLHEVMTLKLPFMVDSSCSFDSTTTGVAAISSTSQVEFDYKAFYKFCDGEVDLPTGTLQSFNISERGIEFIKSLLVPDPRFRPSAANAMKSEWLLELPQLSNGTISGQQRSKSDILRTQMLHLDIGVSHRTANILLNEGGGSNSKTLLNELFPSLKTGINDVLQGALKEGYSLFVSVLKQELDIDRSLFDSFFHTALAAGDSGTIKTLSRIDYIKRSSYSRDVLYAIVKGGHVDMAKLLLEKGADVDAMSDYGQTALHAAAGGGHVDMAKLLLEKGANVHARNSGGRTAVYAAAKGGHVDMVELLLENGAFFNVRNHYYIQTALYAAAKGGHVDMAKLLLEKGADVHATSYNGQTALYVAAEGGHVDIAKLLLEKGANVHATSYNGQTALYVAAEGGHVDIAKLFLEKGADVHATSYNGQTALRAAVAGRHTKIIALLQNK
ncbi:ankyrin repeat-containing domain protein [Morchella snyderi]|nr:ankyrin repeat-containing domain protein [Morchella snyderi]